MNLSRHLPTIYEAERESASYNDADLMECALRARYIEFEQRILDSQYMLALDLDHLNNVYETIKMKMVDVIKCPQEYEKGYLSSLIKIQKALSQHMSLRYNGLKY